MTLHNTNTIPVAALSGGTTNLAGPNVTVATVSGGNTVVNVTAGSVPTLNVVSGNPTSGVTFLRRNGRQYVARRLRRLGNAKQHQHDSHRRALRRHDQPVRSQRDRRPTYPATPSSTSTRAAWPR